MKASASRPSARLLWASVTLLAIALAFLALNLLQGLRHSYKPDVDIVLAVGSSADFDTAGNGLAAVNSRSAALFSPDGSCVSESDTVFSEPVCSASRYLSVFYDAGAPRFLAMTPEGRSETVDTEGGILFADVNENGLLTVLTEKEGYKGSVMVYDRDLTPLFRWDAGSGYPVAARISRDDILCVSTVSDAGSVLHFFRIDRENDLAVCSFPGETVLDFGFLADGTAAAVTAKRLIFVGTDGTERSSYSFGTRTLAASVLSGRFAAIALGDGPMCENAALTTFTPDGTIIDFLPVGREVYALSAADDSLLVLYGEEATLYSSALEEDISRQIKESISEIFLCADGTAYLCHADGAHLVDFNG